MLTEQVFLKTMNAIRVIYNTYYLYFVILLPTMETCVFLYIGIYTSRCSAAYRQVGTYTYYKISNFKID